MDRITDKMLESTVGLINRMTDNPDDYSTSGEINLGHYHITGAYGGVNLARTMNRAGGITNPFSCGHIPKRDLYNRMHAFIAGLRAAEVVTEA